MLNRRFDKVQSRYYNKGGHSGWVSSPVSGKNIGKKQWLQIITNSKLRDRNRFRSIEVKDGFIESSYEMYVDDFRSAVKAGNTLSLCSRTSSIIPCGSCFTADRKSSTYIS